jgi:hypothetical protein
MITVSSLVWGVAGIATGGMHSAGIKSSVASTNEWVAANGMLRLLLIGGVLTSAAIGGYLFSAVTGWLLGFIVTLVVLYRRVS